MVRPKKRKGIHRKKSFYFPDTMLEELNQEARRQERSLSWLMKEAWLIARGGIAKFPSALHGGGAPKKPRGADPDSTS